MASTDSNNKPASEGINLDSVLATRYPILAILQSYLNSDDLWALRGVNRSLHETLQRKPAKFGENTIGCEAADPRSDLTEFSFLQPVSNRQSCSNSNPQIKHNLIRCQGFELGFAVSHGKDHRICRSCAALNEARQHPIMNIDIALMKASEPYCDDCSRDLHGGNIDPYRDAMLPGERDFPSVCRCLQPLDDVILCVDCHRNRAHKHLKTAYAKRRELHHQWKLDHADIHDRRGRGSSALATICPTPGCSKHVLNVGIRSTDFWKNRKSLVKCLVCDEIVQDGLEAGRKLDGLKHPIQGSAYPQWLWVRSRKFMLTKHYSRSRVGNWIADYVNIWKKGKFGWWERVNGWLGPLNA